MRHERFVHAVQHVELQRSARRMGQYTALALVALLPFGSALALLGGGIDAREQLATDDDPVKISDRALDRSFNQDVAAREIQSALPPAMPI